MNISFIGLGFIADLYLEALAAYPHIKLKGGFDINPDRMAKFCDYYKITPYESMEKLLQDKEIHIVLNLTNPHSHFEVSKSCLEAGKHVYSEKPLAMDFDHAQLLVDLAEKQGVRISGAPCTMLSEVSQTLLKVLRENIIGPIRLVYAAADEGMIHKAGCETWKNKSGTPWPYQDELTVGNSLEHSGYYLNMFAALFGPADSVTSFSSTQIPNKGTIASSASHAPDFTTAAIQYHSGVVVRLTCSIVGASDHKIQIFGDAGTIEVKSPTAYYSPIYLRPNYSDPNSPKNFRTRLAKKLPLALRPFIDRQQIPFVRHPPPGNRALKKGANDFARGVDELVQSIKENRTCRLSPELALHVNEIALAIQYPEHMGCPRKIKTTFSPIAPMPWNTIK